jgi:hypothetical protein
MVDANQGSGLLAVSVFYDLWISRRINFLARAIQFRTSLAHVLGKHFPGTTLSPRHISQTFFCCALSVEHLKQHPYLLKTVQNSPFQPAPPPS